MTVGGIATLASGLPYNIATGTTNSGDIGGPTDRPVIDGLVLPRNAGRGRPIYDFSPFVERSFTLGKEGVLLNLRAEEFNVFNHANFVGDSGTYGNVPHSAFRIRSASGRDHQPATRARVAFADVLNFPQKSALRAVEILQR